MESMRGLYSSMTKKVELVGTEEEQASLLGAAPQFRNGAGVTFTRGGGGGGLSVPSLGMPQVGAAAAAAAAVARGY
jgi:outer membrane receptor protein involved in Fe transport